MRAVRRFAGLAIGCAVFGTGVSAQTVGLGIQGVVASYREQTSALQFSGKGFAASAWLARGKLGADFVFTNIDYEPEVIVGRFKARQIDARVRYLVASGVSAEVGFTNRTADPDFDAQSVGAIRVGVRAAYLLGPGADITARANYLAGAKFSGGGTSPFGIEMGLGISVGKSNGRFRLTGDYEFQRFNRTTDNGSGEVKVPIQQTVARIGLGVGF